VTLPAVAPGAEIDWPALEALLDAVVPAEQLAATMQDPGFHAEGDVWTHTRMAVESLIAGPRYAALDPIGRAIVLAAVLLHDVGKPSTTRLESGKLTSRGHSLRGDNLVRVALWRLGVPFGVREQVCTLVRNHQIPFFGITRAAPDAQRLAIRLSLVTRHDWLVAVADADARGRRCAEVVDQVRIIEHCELWAEHCRELGILDRPFVFPTAHTARVWFESEPGSRQPDLRAYDDTACEVVLMCGLPASGKDHWLRSRPELPVISLDELRADLDVSPDEEQSQVIAAARDQARSYLRTATSFAWNATNLSMALRSQLLGLFRGYRARTHVVYCEATAAEQRGRNRARPSPVPAAVIDRMLGRWTVPDPSEAHEVTHLVPAASGDVAWPERARSCD
jgi:predicted kinase